jgi:hypothetical protein
MSRRLLSLCSGVRMDSDIDRCKRQQPLYISYLWFRWVLIARQLGFFDACAVCGLCGCGIASASFSRVLLKTCIYNYSAALPCTPASSFAGNNRRTPSLTLWAAGSFCCTKISFWVVARPNRFLFVTNIRPHCPQVPWASQAVTGIANSTLAPHVTTGA